ncbi:MAG: hypothetical protein ABSG73_11920 [Candidatus Aminicenantales bacterium]|jgi:hypothetical protein
MNDLEKTLRFQTLARAGIEHQWDRFSYYRNLCVRKNLSRADLAAIVADGAYHRFPSVVSTAFKRSKGLIEDLSDLAVPGVFQVSSSTSGDPSYVYTNLEDRASVAGLYARTFASPASSTGIAFAPSLRILRNLSKKAAIMGKSAVLRMQLALEGGYARFPEMDVTLDIDLPKTLLNQALGRPAAIRKMAASAVASFIRNAHARGLTISLGGLTLLLRPYLEEFREGEFSLHDNAHIAFSGGGYSGAKGSIRGAKIDKPAFIARIASVFGIDSTFWSANIKDIYSFTETTAQIEGYWNQDLNDFLFRPSPECRVYIVDPESEIPLRSGRGLIKVVSPSLSGRPASANMSILEFDMAEIVSVSAEGWVESFTRVCRFEGPASRGTEGCAFKAAEIAGE